MGSSNGIFTDQSPEVLQAQVILAATNVVSDFNTIVNENDVVRATNTFLNSQTTSSGSTQNALSAVTQVINQSIGAAQSSDEINDRGGTCFRGHTLFALWDSGQIPMSELYENQDKYAFALSFDEDDNQVKGEIVEVFKNTVYDYVEAMFEDGMTEVVGEHRYYLPSSIYVPIKYLIGKPVMTFDNKMVDVIGIVNRHVPDGVDMYNVHIRKYENYCADGKRVHNVKPNPFLNDGEALEQ